MSLDIPEAVHPHEAKGEAAYVMIPIGHGQHVMVAEADAAQVTARVAAQQAADETLAAQREAARR